MQIVHPERLHHITNMHTTSSPSRWRHPQQWWRRLQPPGPQRRASSQHVPEQTKDEEAPQKEQDGGKTCEN